MKTQIVSAVCASLLAMAAAPALATQITFSWTGQFTVVDGFGGIWSNGVTGNPQTPVTGSFTFDTANPDLSTMTVSLDPFSFYDPNDTDTTITHTGMTYVGTNLLFGQFGLNWCGDLSDGNGRQCYNMDMGVVWDVTGLSNAINYTPGGLQVGDVISGDTVLRNGSPWYSGIGSATPATDGMIFNFQTQESLQQGPAPMATTTMDYGWYIGYYGDLLYGLYNDGTPGMVLGGMPYDQYASASLDIGSGNSMEVTNIVPVPTAVWLFGTGLLGLIGISRRKKAA